jgi:hypothetical protein
MKDYLNKLCMYVCHGAVVTGFVLLLETIYKESIR